MKIIFLGTGTSHGIPMVGCRCPVCLSQLPYNKRMRSSLILQEGETSLLIDTSPELRLQLVREAIDRLDGILYTHTHADHLHGLDDVRPLSCHGSPLPVWGTEAALSDIRERFSYIFDNQPKQLGGGLPRLTLKRVGREPFKVGSLTVTPLPIFHGKVEIVAYRVGPFAYITDCSYIPLASMELLKGVKLLVIGALRYRKHSTHFSVEEALAVIDQLQPEKAFLTHICHDIDHSVLQRELPPHISPAYDGLTLSVSL